MQNETSSKTSPREGRKSGGRKGRIAARQAEVKLHKPAVPGQIGGQYKPLTEKEITDILDTAYRILEEIGFAEVPDVVMEKAIKQGCHVNELGRLSFPRPFVEDIVAGACKKFTFHGRNPDHTIEVGGDRVYYGTGGAAVQTLDMETGLYRSSTLADLHDFTRLIDKLENINWFVRCCVATDIPDNFDLDMNTAFALMKHTEKPVGTSFFIGEHVHPIVEMFDMVAGGEGKFAEAPFCKAHISPVISPLRYGEDAVSVMLACIEHNMPINEIIAAQSGATAPAPLAGMLAQTTAETLAGLILVNLFAPGYPVIFSNWPFVIDLRTGAFCGAGGEISVMNAAAAQIGNYLGLPTGVASSMADAKAVDAQMGAEKAISALACGLAGSNMIYESAGMMGSLLGASFEAFVLDNEMLSHIHRTIRGVEVNEETLGFEAIKEAVTGEGHFLGGTHTMSAMERDYYYPELANRDSPAVWNESGSPDAWETAKQKAMNILENHKPSYIDAAVEKQIRHKWNILSE
ncbi:MAG: trimethylamine methyltransferase family protein [Rhizobiaceae bacterium]|nr:trimethylamine methyltransferase family protein [Rhizobiaceae bacterium]